MHLSFRLLLAICGVLFSQDAPRTVPGANDKQPSALTPEQSEELDRIIHVITSERNDPETRRFEAERLLKSDLPTRIDTAVGFLTADSTPGVSVALCQAIATIGRRHPELLDERLVDPLLALLGSETDRLSSSAASALSAFRNSGVAQRLGFVASNKQGPIGQRMAAIDTLALNTDSRAAVRELISLARAADRAIAGRVMEALKPASRTDYGADVEAWSDWWDQKRDISEKEWLQDRLDLAVDRYELLRDRNQALQRHVQTGEQLIAQRFNELLRTIYQLTPQQAQKEARLQQWLSDSVEDYRLCALGLIRAQVTEGNPPTPSIREAVRNVFLDKSAKVRVEGLKIIGNLKDPQDATVVLALLPNETDPVVREVILRVLGRLENPLAIEALVDVLNNPLADSGCVREAAQSLGTVGAQGRVDAALIAPAIPALQERFHAAPSDDLRLKEALLGAMALIGDPAMEQEFVSNLSAEAPELLLAAIRGIKIIGAGHQIDRLLALLTHVDPRVRQLAADAVGALGSEAQLEALFNRLTPNVEANEGVRNAAWNGFRAVLFRSPASTRLQWASRLDDLPDRQVQLFDELIDTWIANGSTPPELITVRERLVDIHLARGRFNEAVPHLQQLRKHYLGTDAQRASEIGVQLVRAVLDSGRHDRVAEVITEVADGSTDAARMQIADTICTYLKGASLAGQDAQLLPLVQRLQSLPDGLLGNEWPTRLATLADGLSHPPEDEPGQDDRPPSP